MNEHLGKMTYLKERHEYITILGKGDTLWWVWPHFKKHHR